MDAHATSIAPVTQSSRGNNVHVHRVWLSHNSRSNTRDPVAQQFSQTGHVEDGYFSVSILGIVHLRTGNTDSPII